MITIILIQQSTNVTFLVEKRTVEPLSNFKNFIQAKFEYIQYEVPIFKIL